MYFFPIESHINNFSPGSKTLVMIQYNVFYMQCLEHSTIMYNVCVVAQFFPWFKFYFPLFQTHYDTLPYPKTKGNKIWTKDKIEPQHMSQIWMSKFHTLLLRRKQPCLYFKYCLLSLCSSSSFSLFSSFFVLLVSMICTVMYVTVSTVSRLRLVRILH